MNFDTKLGLQELFENFDCLFLARQTLLPNLGYSSKAPEASRIKQTAAAYWDTDGPVLSRIFIAGEFSPGILDAGPIDVFRSRVPNRQNYGLVEFVPLVEMLGVQSNAERIVLSVQIPCDIICCLCLNEEFERGRSTVIKNTDEEVLAMVFGDIFNGPANLFEDSMKSIPRYIL